MREGGVVNIKIKLIGRFIYDKIGTNLIIILAEHKPLFIILLLYLCYIFYIEYKIGYNILNLREGILLQFKLRMLIILFLFLIAQFAIRYYKNDIRGLLPKLYDIKEKYGSIERIGSFILIYILMPFIVSIFESLKGAITLIRPFDWDVTFMHLDYLLHFNNHPWFLLSLILNYPAVLKLIDLFYVIWFLILYFITFWLAWSQRRKLRMQFFICNILILFIIGNILATVFSSAGPCYYSKVTEMSQNNPYEPLMDKLHAIDNSTPLIAIALQESLWNNYCWKEGRYCEHVSAMPSVHVAFAALFALTVSCVSLKLGLLFWGYWAIIQIGSIILGWHYAIDGYLSTILTLCLWKISGFCTIYYWETLPDQIRSQILKPN